MNRILLSNKALYRHAAINAKECGAALTELVISVPFLIVILAGIFEVGRHLAQTTSLVQTSFNAAYLGAGLQSINESSTEQAIYDRAYTELYQAFHAQEFNATPSNPFRIVYVASTSGQNIKLSFSGVMRDLLGPMNLLIPLTLNVDFTLPMLARQSSVIYYDQFENAEGGLYDRFGNFHAGCEDCACTSKPCG